MGYYRSKAVRNKRRSVSGYTRTDGTKVSSYMRNKAKNRKKRYVN